MVVIRCGNVVIGGYGATGKGNLTGFIAPSTGGVYQGNNSSTWSTTSDRRLKKNIVDSTIGLAEINQIKVRNFEYKTEDELSEIEANDWQKIMKAVTDFLTRNHLSWYHINAQVSLPKHLGWSRLACNGNRSRFFYSLFQNYSKPVARNSNERAWIDLGLSKMTESQWDAVY